MAQLLEILQRQKEKEVILLWDNVETAVIGGTQHHQRKESQGLRGSRADAVVSSYTSLVHPGFHPRQFSEMLVAFCLSAWGCSLTTGISLANIGEKLMSAR